MALLALHLLHHLAIALVIWLIGGLIFTHLFFGVRRGSMRWQDRVVRRYQRPFLPAPWIYIPPWVYAWFKVRLDPMFKELPDLLSADTPKRTAIDVGCGWGVPGCALLEMHPELRIHAIEPGRYRSFVVRRAYGDRGTVRRGFAPEALQAGMPQRCDLVIAIDVLHLMPPDAVRETLSILRDKLTDGGVLLARINVPQTGNRSTIWMLDATHRAITRARSFHQPIDVIVQTVIDSGFTIEHRRDSGGNAEMVWLVARPSAVATSPLIAAGSAGEIP